MNGAARVWANARAPYDPKQMVRHILASPRFHLTAARERTSWWSLAMRWLDALLHRLFGGMHGPSDSALQIISVVMLAAAIMLIAVAAIRIVSATAADRNGRPAAARRLQVRANARALYERALNAAAAERFADAAVLLFSAAVTLLDVKGVVRDDPSRTARECENEVSRRAPQALPFFAGVARAFTIALYAGAPVDDAQWKIARSNYERLSSALNDAP